MRLTTCIQATQHCIPFWASLFLALTACQGSDGSIQSQLQGASDSNFQAGFIAPSDHSQVTGAIQVKLDTNQADRTARIDIVLDQQSFLSLNSAPFNFTLNTAPLSNGTHILQAIAVDTDGVSSAPAILRIDVENSGPNPTPTSTPTSTPTPTPSPTTTPSACSFLTSVVGNELFVTDQGQGDHLLVTQSGNTITVSCGSTSRSYTGAYYDVVVKAGPSDTWITIDSSVSDLTRLYGGSGQDTLADYGTGRSEIVSIGGGSDTLVGTSVTSFWSDGAGTDGITSSGGTIPSAQVHQVASFYQPWTTNPSDPNYVTTNLNGPNLKDPTPNGTEVNLSYESLFGGGPSMTDVNQGIASDCYFLSALAAIAYEFPDRLRDLVADLGDGTYAVQFTRNGVRSYIRVDADFPSGGPWDQGLVYAHGAPDLWVLIMEKAYAIFRYGANSYDSLDYGNPYDAFSDLGIQSTVFTLSNPNSSYTQISGYLNSHKGISACTTGSITAGAPLIGSHCYTVLGISKDSGGTVYLTLRNPWGTDGAGSDSNPNDGVVTLTFQQAQANFTILAATF